MSDFASASTRQGRKSSINKPPSVVVHLNRGRQLRLTLRPPRRISRLLARLLAMFAAGFGASAWAGGAVIQANALPTGGQVVGGQASIVLASPAVLDVNQTSSRAVINWLSFNIGSGATVVFQQPSAASIALNRVTAGDASQILGQLSANGQVFLVNPNGVLFGTGAQVNVGGLVASSLDLLPTDFMAGKMSFTGGQGSVTNQGSIHAADGGYVALLGPQVANQGVITAKLGTIALAAGQQVTLQFQGNDLVSLSVDQGAINALAANGQLIQADGGLVIMTAKAASSLASAVVNNTGVVQARTVDDHAGVIRLLGDMSVGTVNVGGTLDASAPNGGDGGSIETSAAKVNVADNAYITTAAPLGKTGTWLIDPNDFTIAPSGGDATGTDISSQLATTNVTITSDMGATAGNGDIFVNDAISWSANTTLTLSAYRNINVNATITATGDSAGLTLNSNTGGLGGAYSLNNGAQINLPGANPSLTINGQAYTVINSLGSAGDASGTTLQGINGNPGGYYALGSNVDASATASWNGGAGFTPIGNQGSPFTGTFDGLGHTVANLAVNLPNVTYVGLFGWAGPGSLIQNVELTGVSVTGGYAAGGLVGVSYGTITNAYASGSVSGDTEIGGLVGISNGSISNSSTIVAVSGNNEIGGLVGNNYGTISASTAGGTVSGTANEIGGLVGQNQGNIYQSSAAGPVSGVTFVGGLVGYSASTTITNSSASGTVTASGYAVGGLVGDDESGSISSSYATGNVSSSAGSNVGGLVGYNHGTSITNSYAQGAVSGSDDVGGLIGYNFADDSSSSTSVSNISGSNASGAVSGSNGVGGLIGYNYAAAVANSGIPAYAILSNDSATGAVNGAGNVGGLVGQNSANVTASGPVYGNAQVNISNSFATGAVSGGSQAGGLVGLNEASMSASAGAGGSASATITNATASGNVSGSGDVGGLVGANLSTSTMNGGGAVNSGAAVDIAGSSAAGNVTNSGDYTGGLVGYNQATANTGGNYSNSIPGNSEATATINGSSASGMTYGAGNYVGGLVGGNMGSASAIGTSFYDPAQTIYSNASGYVAINDVEIYCGGGCYLIAAPAYEYFPIGNVIASAAIGASTAAGSVTGGSYVGGLLGSNSSTVIVHGGGSSGNNANVDVAGSFASGKVVATGDYAGGLIGFNSATATVDSSYSYSYTLATASASVSGSSESGTVNSGGSYVGGLIGYNFSATQTSEAATYVPQQEYYNSAYQYWTTISCGPNSTCTVLATGYYGPYWAGGYTTYFPAPEANAYAQIYASATTGGVNGVGNYIGGLIGSNIGSSSYSAAIGSPYTSTGPYGNLVDSNIVNSYASGAVNLGVLESGGIDVGGLVGQNLAQWGGGASQPFVSIENSYAEGAVIGGGNVGGLVGYNVSANIGGSHATGNVSGVGAPGTVYYVGGLVGASSNGTISGSYATGAVNGQDYYVGGLVGGAGGGSISISYATGSVSGSYAVGGLVGSSSANITSSNATGVVAGTNDVGGESQYIGGLVGWNQGGSIGWSYAKGAVSGALQVGGLVGESDNGSISGSYAEGAVTAGGNVGGLVGYSNSSSISGSYAAGNVTGVGAPGTVYYVGGLVGVSLNSSIAESYATGAVNGQDYYVGGLVGGAGGGSISYSSATGSVSGSYAVGGLVGSSSANITNSYATGVVAGTNDVGGESQYIGGLVGWNQGGSIGSSYATGTVSGSLQVGGLVGESDNGSISGSYANGPVSGGGNVGGLVGTMSAGSIEQSYATGSVTGVGAPGAVYDVGGLVAADLNGTIDQAFATGAVNNASGYYTGGLVGQIVGGSITNSYASGAVTGFYGVGGLVGLANTSINAVYSTGMATGTSYVGGLVGLNSGNAPTNAYWDVGTSGQSSSAGGQGLATYDLMNDGSALGFDFTNTWSYNPGTSYPYLRFAFPHGAQVISGTLSGAEGGASVPSYAYGQTVATATTGANGFFYTLLQPNTVPSGEALYTGTSTSGQVQVSNGGDAAFQNLLPNTLSIGGTITNVSSLATAAGSLPASLFPYTTTATTVAMNPGINVQTLGGTTLVIDESLTTFGQQIAIYGQSLLRANAVIDSTAGGAAPAGAAIAFNGTVDGAYALTLTSGTSGSVSLFSPVGSATPLTSLSATGSTINLRPVTTTGDQTYVSSISTQLNGTLTAGGGLNSVVIAAGQSLYNNAGSGAINPGPGGNWLIYSSNPANDTFGGLASGNLAVWDATYAANPPASVTAGLDQYLFAYQPLLTIVANNATKVYGSTPVLTYSASGLVNAATYGNVFTQDALSGSPTLSSLGTPVNAQVAGSPYTITPSLGPLLGTAGYALNFVNGELTVTPLALTVTAAGINKSYDGTSTATVNLLSNALAGDALTLSYGSASFNNPSAGIGKPVSVTGIAMTGADAGDYTLGNTSTSTTANINQDTLTVTANNASKTYNKTPYSGGAGVVYSGFVDGQTSSVLSGTLSYGGSSQGAVNAGSYAITPGGLSASNYAIVYVNGTLTINPAPLTVTAPTVSRVYNGTTSASGTSTVKGLVAGDTTLDAATLTFNTPNVGTGLTVTPSNYVANDGNGGNNYVVTYVANTASKITPAALSITANSVSMTYDGQAYGGGTGVSYAGFVTGDSASVLGGTLAYSGSSQGAVNAGSYTITPGGLTASNYTITFKNGILTIKQAPLTIAANDYSEVYNGLAYSGGNGVSYTGFVNGETTAVLAGGLTYSGTSQGATGAGSYAITPGGYTATNYAITYKNGTLTISKAPLTIAAAGYSESYNGQAYSGGNGVSYTGFVNGETTSVLGGALAYVGTSQGAVNAGSYKITPSGLTSSNYAITYTSGTLTISKDPLTITANNYSEVYNGAAYSGGNGVTYSGFVNNETAAVLGGTLTYGGNSQGAINAGTYNITASGLTSANYTITYVKGTLTITPAPLTITAISGEIDYTGTKFSGGFGVTYSGFVGTDTASVLGGTLKYTGTSQGAKAVGTYAITPEGLTDSNYTIIWDSGTLTIVSP